MRPVRRGRGPCPSVLVLCTWLSLWKLRVRVMDVIDGMCLQGESRLRRATPLFPLPRQ
jgi:hypothetical protein